MTNYTLLNTLLNDLLTTSGETEFSKAYVANESLAETIVDLVDNAGSEYNKFHALAKSVYPDFNY